MKLYKQLQLGVMLTITTLCGLSACGGGGSSVTPTNTTSAPVYFNVDAALTAYYQNGYRISLPANALSNGYSFAASGAAAVSAIYAALPASAVAASEVSANPAASSPGATYTDYYTFAPFTRLARVFSTNTYPFYTNVAGSMVYAATSSMVFATQTALPVSGVPGQNGPLDSYSMTASGVTETGVATWQLVGTATNQAQFCIITAATINVVPAYPWWKSECYLIDTTGKVLGRSFAFQGAPAYNNLNVSF